MTALPAVRRLPDAVVNKIAAGEVIERPASIVKELVENSLDAGATRIEVAVRGAGRQLVAVTDDGRGMTPEDCLLALERHATSKLAHGEPISTPSGRSGFAARRCPPSSPSRGCRSSRGPPTAPRGFLVIGEGGVVGESGPADAPAGTAVEVRDLFFNTPARAKFLKSPATEQTAIVRVVTQLALGNPGVHVRLVANGRTLLNAPAGNGVRERIGALYGFGLASRLLDVSGEGGGARLAGVVAPPSLARTHRDDIHLLVNGRVVRDTLLTQALLEAFRPLLPRDQFPLAALTLEVDPGEVDVNVHPAKTWIRFRRPRALHDLVLESVRTALRQLDAAPAGLAARLAGDAGDPSALGIAGLVGVAAPPAWAAEEAAQTSLFREGEAGYRGEPFFGRVVGQIEDTFIVAHTAEEVFFVDQHVAHERVLFERFRDEVERGGLVSQELLFPLALELAPGRLRALERAQPELTRLGFALEGFGAGAVLLRAVPSLLRTDELARLADELGRELDEDAERGGSPVLDRLLAFVACRAAVKAHEALAAEEMAQLLTDLAVTATPYYCPHGRPIVSRIPLGEIKRELRRTW